MKKHRRFGGNIRKEEAFINEQIARGYRLTKVNTFFGTYYFEEWDNKAFTPIVRIDFRKFHSNGEYLDYISLFEDSGWKFVVGSSSEGYQYFERTRGDADTEIFSDKTSTAERYKRISQSWLELFAVYLPLLVVFQTTGAFDFHKMLHPKELYYTPGLWDATGLDFWRAFLFETPFALGRGFLGLLFLIIVLTYCYFGLKALYWYYKEKKEL